MYYYTLKKGVSQAKVPLLVEEIKALRNSHSWQR